eukprot:TRINITY_DN2984_c0_g1_i1.p1 TRINITY_DN2984_c0_g1~~TRINITY_DN2984_c0_g1_i1.p1  ORF type:complete len:292 (+),score=80.51 TRINITY_DN2984_c0_g1_i1:35-877(+)
MKENNKTSKFPTSLRLLAIASVIVTIYFTWNLYLSKDKDTSAHEGFRRALIDLQDKSHISHKAGEEKIDRLESKLENIFTKIFELQEDQKKEISSLKDKLTKTEQNVFNRLSELEAQLKTKILTAVINNPSTLAPNSDPDHVAGNALKKKIQDFVRVTLSPLKSQKKKDHLLFMKEKFAVSKKVTSHMSKTIDFVTSTLKSKNREKLAKIFNNCYPDTFMRSLTFLEDGTSFIVTGDIPHMWMRDCVAQVHHYVPLLNEDLLMQIVIEGMIKRMAIFYQL